MGETDISWTHRPGTIGRSWNPGQGCSLLSEGCRNCYAMRLAARFAENGWSKGLINLKTRKWNGTVRLAAHKLAEPLSWTKPSTVFVNSMTDMFHEGYSNEDIAAVFGVMAACPQHTFQLLTKRAKRMREWFEWARGAFTEQQRGIAQAPNTARAMVDAAFEYLGRASKPRLDKVWHALEADPWPLPNAWIGVSVENQDAADERIPELLETPAAMRFLSCEPLLGPVDISEYFDPCSVPCGEERGPEPDWVIAGCESGPGARACDVAWLRSLRDQCADARVAFFLKQAVETSSSVFDVDCEGRTHGVTCGTGSKMKAGKVVERPYMDNVQHLAFPEVRHG